MFGFFFSYQFCNSADLLEVSNLLVPHITTQLGHCSCVCDLLRQQSPLLGSACSGRALFCSPQHPSPGPQVPCKCLCLHILPIPVWDLPLRMWDDDTSGATACSRHLSSDLVCSSRRMMRMRILPLAYLTVTFSSKMATSEQRHDPSCQFVSTQFMLLLYPRPLLCSVPVGSCKWSRTHLSILPLIPYAHIPESTALVR